MKRQAQRKQAAASEEGVGAVYVITSRGVKVKCNPVAGLLEEQRVVISESIDWPERPLRTVEGPDHTVDVPMNQKYIDTDPGASDEDKAAWAEYVDLLAQAQQEFEESISINQTRILVHQGIDIVDREPDEQWIEDQAYFGMPVDEDPRERAIQFFNREVIGNHAEDTLAITTGIYRVSGYGEEVIARIQESFRSAVGAFWGAFARPDNEAADAGEGGEEDGVADESEVPDGEGGE